MWLKDVDLTWLYVSTLPFVVLAAKISGASQAPSLPAHGPVKKKERPSPAQLPLLLPKQLCPTSSVRTTTTTPTALQSLVFPCTFFIHLVKEVVYHPVLRQLFHTADRPIDFLSQRFSSPASRFRLLSLTASSPFNRSIFHLSSIGRSQTWALPAKPRLKDSQPTIRRGGIQIAFETRLRIIGY